MTRSQRKTPIVGFTTADSEARDKALWHRAWRRLQRQRLAAGIEESVHAHEVSSPWTMDKDGKQYLKPKDRSLPLMRK